MATVLQYASKGSEEWAKSVVKLAKSNLIRGKKNKPGTLLKSISYTIDPRTLEIDFYYEDYGEYVESGRKKYPGRGVDTKGDFFKSVKKWAKLRGIPQFRDKKGRYISSDSRAYILARSINIKGIRPFPFFTDAIEDSISKLYSNLQDNIAKDIEDGIVKSLGGL